MSRNRMFQIQCGEHQDTVLAPSIGRAWHKLTKGQTTGFSELARFREALPFSAGRKHRGGWQAWQYITPQALDRAALEGK